MKIQLSLLALAVMAATSTQAMQALDDSSMSTVTGQAGLTIEQTTSGHEGLMLSTGEIKFTQADTAGKGEVDVTVDGMSVRSYIYDDTMPNNFGGFNTIKRVIDIDADGNLTMKTMDVDTMDIKIGAIAIGGRRVNSGIDINVWKFASGSYLETEILNDPAGAKIISRTVMEVGSGYNQIVYENDVQISSDTVYLPNFGEAAFASEVILTSEANGLKLEVGETRGTMEIQNLSILDENGINVFGAGNSFGDLGYGNITVNKAYITIAASSDPLVRNGLEGKIYSDMEIGSAYYRTNNARMNFNNIKFTTGGELTYNLEFMNNGYASGIEAQFVSSGTASLRIGEMTFSNAHVDGLGNLNETTSLGGLAISNLSLNGGTAEIGLYTLSGYGVDGMRQVVNATGKTSFDLEVFDEFDMNNYDNAALKAVAPKLTANIVINNFAQDQTINNTKKGIRILTASNSFDMNVNAIKVGNGSLYQGQSGRLVMNNVHQVPGGYTNIEPLR